MTKQKNDKIVKYEIALFMQLMSDLKDDDTSNLYINVFDNIVILQKALEDFKPDKSIAKEFKELKEFYDDMKNTYELVSSPLHGTLGKNFNHDLNKELTKYLSKLEKKSNSSQNLVSENKNPSI